MSDLAKFKTMPPLQVTYAQIVAILEPITRGYPWGEGTIRDLWLMGAPTPDSTIHNERRIVFPGQLAKWLEDVLTKKGDSLDGAAKVYMDLRKKST